MRYGIAVLVAGLAVGGAVYLGSLHLGAPGPYRCFSTGGVVPCYVNGSSRVVDRAGWQIPVAVLIAILGIGTGALIARPRSGGEVSTS